MTPKMEAFVRAMERLADDPLAWPPTAFKVGEPPYEHGWSSWSIAHLAGYSATMTRNGASPRRTLEALKRRGRVLEVHVGYWRLPGRGGLADG